jgi:predicted alpha/beta-fold hydrolase
MNLRGCSGEFNRLAVAYHSGCSHDVEEVMDNLLTAMPATQQLMVIGYSLGANVLIKWLSETRHKARVLAGVSVSNPFMLALCCGRMNSGMAFWYGRYFLSRLRRDLDAKRQHFEQSGQHQQLQVIQALGSLQSLKTLWDFDDAVTAPLHGFANTEDYWRRASAKPGLRDIACPSLLIHARNDPFVPVHSWPQPDQVSPSVALCQTETGGHVGFLQGPPPGGLLALPEYLMQWWRLHP